MKPLTVEWVTKAEADYLSAHREYRARKHPNDDASCFHAQQSAEKYLKAILQESDVPFHKTHNLIALLELLLVRDSSWELHRLPLQILGQYAVEFRYPGNSADRETAKEALRASAVIRLQARQTLGITNSIE